MELIAQEIQQGVDEQDESRHFKEFLGCYKECMIEEVFLFSVSRIVP